MKDIRDMTDEDFISLYKNTEKYIPKQMKRTIPPLSDKKKVLGAIIEDIKFPQLSFIFADELRKLGYKVEADTYR